MAKTKVSVIKDGPFKVENPGPIEFEEQKLTADKEVYLCRCGKSNKAPFCDGAHSRNGFDDTCEPLGTPAIREWEGKRIRTSFNAQACMHDFHCKPMKELRAKEPEAADDTVAKEIEKVVQSCPSGALTCQWLAEKGPKSSQSSSAIKIVKGGEIRITGDFEPVNFDLQEKQDKTRATLCRCGLSKNKPYCDASHRKKSDFR